jgi:enterobactin synthetase component D
VLPDFARQFHLYLDQPLPSDIDLIPVPSTLEGAIPKRRMQFRAGRYCAIKAMEALCDSSLGDARDDLTRVKGSVAQRRVGRNAIGAPLWPAGIVGSITHTDDFASAAVALTADAMAVGIDTERVMSESQSRNVSRIVAWPAEVAYAREAGLRRLEALTLVFSAKESVFKCLHPLISCYFDFRDVRIIAVDGQLRTFGARLVRTLSEGFAAGTILEGRFDVEVPWVHTGIALTLSRVGCSAGSLRLPVAVDGSGEIG